MSSESAEIFTWMNGDYFKSILAKYEGHDNDVELIEFSVNSGSVKGENFASAIYRAKLSYLLNQQPKEASFIIKTTSASSAISELLENMGTFDHETHIYQKVLTECEKLFPDTKLSPRLLYVDKNALVLEDLNQLGYKLENRKVRLDVKRAELVLKKLAMFHAATSVIYEKQPELMEGHMKAAFDSEEMTPLSFFFAISLQETLETIRGEPDLAKFLPLLENFDIVERGKNIFRRTAGEKFHTLNHGDLWINNIFMSFNENEEPLNALLVDYQECFWGSPGIDLNHFFYTSCNFDVHENHIDELIKFYYDHLVEGLKQLGHPKIPTLNDIREEFDRKSDQGLVALCSIVPAMMIENTEHANPENFIADGEGAAAIRREVYSNPKFVEVLKVLLPKFTGKK